MNDLKYNIRSLLDYTNFDEYGDMSVIKYDYLDPDEHQLLHTYENIISELDAIHDSLNYYNRRTTDPQVLYKNAIGRYQTDTYEYTSGHTIEFLLTIDDYFDHEPVLRQEWIVSRVEYGDDDYYIVGYQDIPLEGLTVRRRTW